MKLMSVTGVTSVENVKCLKPVCKIFVVAKYPEDWHINGGIAPVREYSDPLIRVRLVDGATGNSRESVPEMHLSVLSEISSKYEGFQRKAVRLRDDSDTFGIGGSSYSSVILGQQLTSDVISSIDLSNDKYLDIDLRELDPLVTYEIWGFESHIIKPFIRVYSKFYLASGELEKTFSCGENEVLVYPILQIKELQVYAKNSMASPTYRKEELIMDEDGRNDLVHVELDSENNAFAIDGSALGIKFGYSKYGIMSIGDFSRFDVRRDDGLETLTFLMIDTVPTVTN